MLAGAGVTRVKTGPVANVTVAAGRLLRLVTTDGAAFSGDAFVDASYTGDLAVAANVTTTWGRESREMYNESWAGRREPFEASFDTKAFSPLDAAGALLPLMTTRISAPLGSGDARVQGYNYRLCVTQNASNLLPFPAPATYDPATWEALRRQAQPNITAPDFGAFVSLGALPAAKFGACARPPPRVTAPAAPDLSPLCGASADLNNGDFMSTDATGLSWAYPNASYAARAALDAQHREYMLQFFYFLQAGRLLLASEDEPCHPTPAPAPAPTQNDPGIPAALRASSRSWGLCADEFTDAPVRGWPEQLYVREARRVVGDTVSAWV